MASTYSNVTTFITTICSIIAQVAERRMNGFIYIQGNSGKGLEGTTTETKKRLIQETTPLAPIIYRAPVAIYRAAVAIYRAAVA